MTEFKIPNFGIFTVLHYNEEKVVKFLKCNYWDITGIGL